MGCLRGYLQELFYDEDVRLTDSIDLKFCRGLEFSHRPVVLVEVLERDTVIMDVKDEKYEPLEVGDVMRV